MRRSNYITQTDSITTFQELVAKPFATMQKAIISSRFVSQYIVSPFSIFDPNKVPATDSSDLLAYVQDIVDLMLAHHDVKRRTR